MKKILLTLTMLLMMFFVGRAQEKGLYLTVGGSLGANKYQYQLDNGNMSTPRLGFGGNLGVQYFFTKHWGLATGLGLTFYNSQGKYNNDYQKDPNHYSFQNMYDDDFRNLGLDDKNYTLRLGLSDWKEIQQGYFLEIPLMFMYQTKLDKKEAVGMYFGLGPKVQIPVISQSYKVSNGSELSVSAYYPKPDAVFPDPNGPDMTRHGYGQNTKTGYTGDMDIKTSFAASGEVGFLFGLSPRVDLTVGAYLDYGLTNVKDGNKTEEGYLINPENGAKTIQPSTRVGDHLAYNGYINSHAVDKTNLFAVGAKVGIRIKLGKVSKSEEPLDATTEIQKYPNKDTVYIIRSKVDTVYIASKPKIDTIYVASKPKIYDASKPKVDTIYVVSKPKIDTVHIYQEGVGAKVHKEEPTKEELNLLSQSIFFDLDKDILSAASIKTLNSMVEIMEKYPNLHLLITGNTCNLGTNAHNIDVGLKRALAAKKYLESKGVNKSRISAVSQSYANPISPNNNEHNRVKNRRCDFYPMEY